MRLFAFIFIISVSVIAVQSDLDTLNLSGALYGNDADLDSVTATQIKLNAGGNVRGSADPVDDSDLVNLKTLNDTAATRAALGDDVNFRTVTIGNYYCSGALYYLSQSNGILGTTNVDTVSGNLSSRSIDIIVSGNNYIQDTVPTNYRFKFLTTSGGFLRVFGITNNNVQDSVYLFRRQGKVCFWIPPNSTFRTKRFCIGNADVDDPPTITFTNEACPTDTTKMVIVPFKKSVLSDANINSDNKLVKSKANSRVDTTNIKVSADTTFFPGWLTWYASVALPTIGTKYSNQPFVIATGSNVADPDSGPHLAMFPINSASNEGKVRFASANNVGASIDILTNALRWYYDPSEASTSTPNFQVTPNTITGNGPLLVSGTGAIEIKGSASDYGIVVGEVTTLGDKTRVTDPAAKNSISSDRTVYTPKNDTIATIDLDSLATPYEYTYIMQHTETGGGSGYDTIKISENDSLLDGNYVYIVTVGGVANQQSKAAFAYSNSDGWKTIYEVFNSSALIYTVGSAEGTRIIYSYSSAYEVNQTTVTVKRILSDKEYLDSMHVALGGLARARNGYVDIPYKINIGTTSGNMTTVIDSTQVLVTKNGGDTLLFIDDNDRIKSNVDSMNIKGYIKSTAIFGNIGTHDDTTATAVATGTSYTKLTGFNLIGFCSRVVGDTAHDQFTFVDTGYYKVEYSLSGYCASNAIKWIFTPFLNGVEQALGHSQSKLANANDIQNYGASTIIHVSALTSGFPLYIGARHNSVSTETFNLTYSGMVVTYLGNIE